MKKDTVRKIAAALFFLSGLLLILIAHRYVASDKVILGMGEILFACAAAALGACAWLDKKTGFKIAALAATAAGFVRVIPSFSFNVGGLFYSIIDIIIGCIGPVAAFQSCLILSFAASAKKDPFALSLASAICMAASGLLGGDIYALSLALSILFWGISQRKPKMPVLAAGAPIGDALSSLEKLSEFRQGGEITQEEYDTQKAELLKRL